VTDDLTELHGDRFRARLLNADDGPALQRLLEACADYCELVLGRPPGPAEAQAVFSAGPEEGRDPADKILMAITRADGEELIGVLDGFRDYPEPGVWYLGLLLLSPLARRGGVGAEVVEAFAHAASARGARELQLNVVEQNVAGYRFWTARAFEEVRRWRQQLGVLESTFIRMRRALEPII
jgi:GNAT superfamily N-acetyltransferase